MGVLFMHRIFGITQTLAVSALTLSLAACATAPRGSAEARLEQQSEWFSSSHIQGCLIGAALGGGICAAAGGNVGTCVASALAGCGLGYTAAQYMNQKRQQYASQEQMLQSIIADVRQDNQRISSYLATERQVIQENLKKLDRIEQAYAQKKISLDEAKSQVSQLRDTQKLLEEKVKDLRNVEKQWQDRYAMANDPRVAQEVQSLKQQVDTAHQDVQSYVERLNVSTIG
jgi:uncharacterized protein YcfJ